MDEDAELYGAEAEKASSGSDTESDSACEAVQSLVDQISREQGGTENVTIDASEKGNDDGFDLSQSERVNSDPQNFQWNEQPREGSEDHMSHMGY